MRVVVFHQAGSTVCDPEHVPALVREHGRVVVEPLGHTGQPRRIDAHLLDCDPVGTAPTPDSYRPETATADRWLAGAATLTRFLSDEPHLEGAS